MKGAYAAGLALAFLLALLPGSFAHASTLTLSDVTIRSYNEASSAASSTLAAAGDRIYLVVSVPQQVDVTDNNAVASSTISGHNVRVNCSGDRKTCSAEYYMQTGDAEGVIPFTFSASTNGGNDWAEASSTTDGSFVEFDDSKPIIGVINADATAYALSKSISATATDAHLATFEEATTTGSCSDPLSFTNYVNGSALTFSSTTDNGTKVCFKATDALGQVQYAISNALAHIGTDPNPAPVVTSATITLTGGNTTNVAVGDTFTDPGATALGEPGDVDLTSSIQKSGDSVNTSQIGAYRIHYSVFDGSGTPLAEVIRTVVVQDSFAPVITLNGDASMSLTVGDTFADPGATANDPQDGDVAVSVSGSVDTSNAGTYTLTYTATDSSNNTSTAIRTVTVVAKPVQHSSGGGGGGSRPGSSVIATSTLADGQVLGAATYNFLTDLKLGSTGADVTALQQILIAGHYLSVAAPTGYFGLGTQAAVEAYQAAHGIAPASGYVGPLTRASLSAGSVQTGTSGSVIDRSALLLQISELMRQVAALEAELAALQ